jgi:hypothetical protein
VRRPAISLKVRNTVTCRAVWALSVAAALTAASAIVAPIGVVAALASTPPAGTVVAWGTNWDGQTNVPAGLTGVVQVSAGEFHSLALKSDGTVVAWGYDNVPAGLTGVVQVSAGCYHDLVLKDDGTVVAWGADNAAQTDVPAGLTGVVQVSAGCYHSLALKDDGTVVAWGAKDPPMDRGYEQIDFGQADVPAGLTGVVQVSAGGYHSLAVKSDGTVTAWGGDPDYGATSAPAGLTEVVQVSAGGYHSLALKNDGTVVGWGANYGGQTTVPAGLTGVTQVSAGGDHSLAVKSDGTVAAWGDNDFGQRKVPAGLTGVTQVAAGAVHSLALVVDRAVLTFRSTSRTVAENAGVVHLVVTRTNLTDISACAHYARTGGTATPGTDFTLTPGTVDFAPGETSKTIPVTIIDDASPERDETIIITLRDPAAGTSTGPAMRLSIRASDQRPDALISTSANTGYIGSNIYNSTGAHQTKTLSARRGQARTFWVRIYNDGNTWSRFTIRASAAGPGSTVRFYWYDTNITKALRSSRGWIQEIWRGYVQFRMRITVAPSARIGTVKSVSVTATWTGDRTLTDLVKARVRVIA